MIVIGDTHFKNEQPFLYHQLNFLQWLEQFKDEEMLFLGDIFDNSVPMWTVYQTFKKFLIECRNAPTHILQGNHDYSKRKGSSVKAFELLDNVHVYTDAEEFTIIEGFKCLALPWKYNTDNYNDVQFSGDFCFTHTMPKEEAFGNEYVDLSHIDANLIYGHIHLQRLSYKNKLIIGVPIWTKKGEQNNPIIRIKENKEIEYIKHPIDFSLEQIEFGEVITNKYNIYEILNAPDSRSIFEQYKDAHIRIDGCTFKQFQTENELEEIELDSIAYEFNAYCKEELVDDSIKTLGLKYLDKVETLI